MTDRDWLELDSVDPEAHVRRLRDQCLEDMDVCRIALNSLRLAYQVLPDQIHVSKPLKYMARSLKHILLRLNGGPRLHLQLRTMVEEAILESGTVATWRAITPCKWAHLIRNRGLLQLPRQEGIILDCWAPAPGLLVQLPLRRELQDHELILLLGTEVDASQHLVKSVLREIAVFADIPRGFLRPLDIVLAVDEEEVDWDLCPSIVASALELGLVQRVADWSPLHPDCPPGCDEGPIRDARGRWQFTVGYLLRAVAWGFSSEASK